MATLFDSIRDALVARFGRENVHIPTNTGADTFSGWYPIAIKQRQAGIETAVPLAVVAPADTAEVAALIRYAHENRLALLPVGGGSNTVGSTTPGVSPATIAVRLSRLDTVAWDETALTVTVGAGVVLADLEETLNRHGYTLGSLPQSARIATVGGAVATEAFGTFAAGYGGMRENTLALEAILSSGAMVQTSANGATTRALHHLLIGTEGAFGIVTSATLAIRPQPEVRAWCAFTFPRFDDAADALRLLYRSDARPACLRLFDAEAAQATFAGQVPTRHAVLLLGVEGSEIVQTGQYQTVFAVCQKVGGAESAIDGDAWFESERFRTDAFAANGRPGAIADVISLFAPWSVIPALYRDLTQTLRPETSELSAQIGFATPHGAALDLRFVAETASPTDAIARHERILVSAKEIVTTHGANMPHHYGVGRSHRSQFGEGDVHYDTLSILQNALRQTGAKP